MEALKKIKWDVVIISVVIVALGTILVIFPTDVNRMIAYVLSGFMFLISAFGFYNYFKKDAITQFYRNDLVLAVAALVVGIVLIANAALVESAIVPLALSILVIISGVRKLQHSLDLVRIKLGGWLPVLILAGINLIYGVILICLLNNTAIIILIGSGLIFSGLSDLFSTLWISGLAKKQLKTPTTQTEANTVDTSKEELKETIEPEPRETQEQPPLE